jgi:hypothetical protein
MLWQAGNFIGNAQPSILAWITSNSTGLSDVVVQTFTSAASMHMMFIIKHVNANRLPLPDTSATGLGPDAGVDPYALPIQMCALFSVASPALLTQSCLAGCPHHDGAQSNCTHIYSKNDRSSEYNVRYRYDVVVFSKLICNNCMDSEMRSCFC